MTASIFFGLLIFLVAVVSKDAVENEAPEGMVLVKGGSFMFGVQLPIDSELKWKKMRINDFYLDETPVTNRQFKAFVEATEFKTEAESFDWSFVFQAHYQGEIDDEFPRVKDQPWWLAVKSARWDSPEGLTSDIEGRLDYPVTQVSYNDAISFCDWSGKMLPSETQWEYAARGGTDTDFWYGKNIMDGDTYKLNYWQGEFPDENLIHDGYPGTSPVKAYEPNPFGIYDMVGNVWEWTSTSFHHPGLNGGKKDKSKKTIRGGSFVDTADRSANHRIRVTARMGNTRESSASNMGFRCAKKVKKSKQKKEL